jgi:anaerobic ribonucleoside-triphosphate reductase activating protein
MEMRELSVIAGQVAVGTWGDVEGVTVLGGEPTDQAKALEPLLSYVRELGLSVMLYSGNPMRWFYQPENEAARRLLDVSDILVDGPFLSELANPELRWRGSRNQRIIRLTARYSVADLESEMLNRGVTLRIASRTSATVSGLQERSQARAVELQVRDLARGLQSNRR